MPFSIASQPIEDIATWMKLPTSNVPKALRGIFFMDGNPLPDDCLTLHNLEWDEDSLSLMVPVANPLQWTFHHNIFGWILLISAWIAGFRYKIQFEDDSLRRAQITPIALGIPVPKWFVNPTMCQPEGAENGDVWERKNIWLGGVPWIGEYVMRRVVDEQGQELSAFKEMLKQVGSDCFVIE